MTGQSPGQGPAGTDQILDLLLDALAERQRARAREAVPSPQPSPSREREVPPSPRPSAPREREATPSPEPSPSRERVASIHLGKTLVRLLILVAALVILVNIPVTRYGTSLARILPESQALIIRDGLVLKGAGPEIYILEDNRLRWISSLDAFDHLGLTWGDVRIVDDEFLGQFEVGHPIHLILKCDGSPHIFALENGEKRWIKDIETFSAEGYVWEDVNLVSCPYLRSLPDGVPIPEDAGAPPEP